MLGCSAIFFCVTLPPTTRAQLTLAGAEVWFAVRTDGKVGSGKRLDPYDGGNVVNFDRKMALVEPNTIIHFGRGTFHTDCAHQWTVKDGWHVLGSGIERTTIQMVGTLGRRAAVRRNSSAVFTIEM